jgi:hypothetical protein
MKTLIYQERRQTPRFAYTALAVLKTPEGPTVAEAQIMDLSLEGACVNVPIPRFADQEFLLVINVMRRYRGGESFDGREASG